MTHPLLSRWKTLRSPAPAATVDPSGAQAAAAGARAQLEEERTRTRDIYLAADSLRDLRTKNHFADLWNEAALPPMKKAS
jgi:hypothetical protein